MAFVGIPLELESRGWRKKPLYTKELPSTRKIAETVGAFF